MSDNIPCTSAEIKTIKQFFIVGRSRSGTTLLRTMLDSHPNISVPNECPFILQLSNNYKNVKKWTPTKISAFIIDLQKTWLFNELNINLEELKKDLLTLGENISYSIVCKTVSGNISCVKQKKNLIYLGDKNPSYSLQFNTLYKIFGNQCKYIFINRDYRDQFVSLKNTGIEIPNIVISTKRWVKAYKNFKKHTELNSANFYTLRYEDLANHPEKELSCICNFLGTSYTPEMLAFYKNKESLSVFTETSLNGVHKSITMPVHTSKINVWKKELNKNEIGLADKIAGKHAIDCGYEHSVNLNSFTYFFLSLPGNFLYGIILLSSQILQIMPLSISLKFSGGAYLGKKWNQYLRKK